MAPLDQLLRIIERLLARGRVLVVGVEETAEMRRASPRPRPTASGQRFHVRHTDDRPRLPRFLGKLPQSPTTSASQEPALGRISHVASVFNQIEHLVERVHVVNRGPHNAKPLGRLAIVDPHPW